MTTALDVAKSVAYDEALGIDSLKDFAEHMRVRLPGVTNDEIKSLWAQVLAP